MIEQKTNIGQIDVLGNIYNNILKGLSMGKTLIMLQGSARSGKSRNTMIFLCLQCINEVKKVSVVRQSLPTIKRSILEDFKIVMQQMGQWEDRRFNKTDFVYYFPNGSIMEFFSAEDEQKLRGPSRDILYANEANEISYHAFSNLRMRTYGFCIVDYNPTFTEEHWLFPLMTDERTYLFKSTFEDNIFLPKAARDEILSYKETNPALWKIYGEGEFAIIEGLVFPKENWDIIPDENYPTWLGEEYIGIDWGFASDPTTFIGVIINGDDIYARELCYATEMRTHDIAKALEPYKDNYKYCDIDNRLVTELEEAGIPMLTMTRKNGESIMSGIRLMNQRHIHITASSTDLIKEFRNYVYKKDRHETYQTNLRPIDKFNHCFTGDTLIQTVNGAIRIDSLCVGDIVYTSQGVRSIEKVFHNGTQEVWDIVITCVSGEEIMLSVTPTHKIKANGKWKLAQKIKKGDVIYLFNSSMGKSITSTMEKNTFHEGAGESLSQTNSARQDVAVNRVVKSIQIDRKYKAETYNLMINTTHEYFANGVLVSNCIDALRYVVYAECSGKSYNDTHGFSKEELGIFM